ncbi:MAG: hypothetical protein Q9N34_08315 [Aquificota bacterium]|nr:hypothetical protein [Aquificota bacterium]
MKRGVLLGMVVPLVGGLFSCGGTSGENGVKAVYFEPLPLAKTVEEKKKVRVSSKLIVEYQDGSSKEYPISYRILLRSGDAADTWQFGTLYDKNLQAIKGSDNSPIISNNPDADSLLEAGNRRFLVTHFEERPGAIYITELDDKGNAIYTKPVDVSSIGGTIINCAGIRSPLGAPILAQKRIIV